MDGRGRLVPVAGELDMGRVKSSKEKAVRPVFEPKG